MSFEKYSGKMLEEIQEDLETIYVVLQNSYEAKEFTIDRFEGILDSDFGANLRKLRNQNIELTETVRLKAVAEVEKLIDEIESEIANRYL